MWLSSHLHLVSLHECVHIICGKVFTECIGTRINFIGINIMTATGECVYKTNINFGLLQIKWSKVLIYNYIY
jgi:hypothetical protein